MSAESESPIRRLIALDRTVHEPARLAILLLLSVVEQADFLYILGETGMSKGNLSSHMARLEEAGFVSVEKAFLEKTPRTVYELTEDGRLALETHRGVLVAAFEKHQ
jgi:DNA-binding transcriptional ArsR family regulator